MVIVVNFANFSAIFVPLNIILLIFSDLNSNDSQEIKINFVPDNEVKSDNRNRTVSDVRHAFSKFGGNLGTDGSVSYLFNKIGIIHVLKNYPEDSLMEIALDSGAEDLTDEGEYFEIVTSSSDLSSVLKSFKDNNIENVNAELTLRAETLISIDQEMSEKVLKIMDFMDELDDVQEVHTNAEFPDNFEIKEN